MLSMLRDILIPGLKPKSISFDFQQAAIKSIKCVFPDVKIYGRLFHSSKMFKKRICELNLQLDIIITRFQ